jgi:glyoxylase-like metal-dependent hydrolase (beta-lactamase superfamily II)
MAGPFRIFKDVYCIGGTGISTMGDCMVYLIDMKKETLVLIDSGVSNFQKIVNNVKTLGFDPKNLKAHIITHCHIDHIGNSARFKKEFNLKVYAHELDAEPIEKGGAKTGVDFYGVSYEPVIIDVKFTKEEETLHLGDQDLKILHIPGHTPGGIAPYIDFGKRVLFAQDVHGPLFPAFGSNRKQFVKSLKKMQELNADILCEGHFGIYDGKDEVRKYIQRYIDQFSG